MSVPLLKPRSDAEIDTIHDSKIRSMLDEFVSAMRYPFPLHYEGPRPSYWPSDIAYCNPSANDALFKNVTKTAGLFLLTSCLLLVFCFLRLFYFHFHLLFYSAFYCEI